MSNSPDNKKAVFPKPKVARAFRIFCCTNPFLTEKYHNIQNSWAKRENSPKYGHGFWLSQIQNGIFGHFALGVSCLHSLMFLSCRNGISMASAIAISIQVHSCLLKNSVVHDRCDLTRFFSTQKYPSSRWKGQSEEGCGEKNDQGGEESTLRVTGKIEFYLRTPFTWIVLVDPAQLSGAMSPGGGGLPRRIVAVGAMSLALVL